MADLSVFYCLDIQGIVSKSSGPQQSTSTRPCKQIHKQFRK